MKKALSLVLALVMALGCMTVPAFAAEEYDLEINGVKVTAEGEISNEAITDGTVTYTAAEHNNGTAKLTLDGATIVSTMGTYSENDAIHTASDAIVIELIGENSVSSGAWPFFFGGNATFIGSGSLTTSSMEPGLYFCKDATFSMDGTVTTNDSSNTGIYCEGSIYLTAGAGKVISHGKDNAMGAIAIDGYGAVVGCKSITGSAANDAAADEATAPATISGSEDWKVSKLVGSDAIAHTIVLTAYPFPVSGSTTITATKAAPFSYEIVIPTNVAEITAAGVYEVGQAKVKNVVSATEDTVISYTATTSDFKLSTDTSKTMAATYYTEQAATNAFPTTAVKVYENKADVASIPTMWVKIAESDWNAAEAGTYTASVVFNFGTEDAAPVISTVEDLIPENFPFSADPRYWANNAWKNDNNRACFSYTSMGNPWLAFSDTNSSGSMDGQILLVCSTPVTKTSNSVYTATQDNITFVFTLTDSVLTSIQLSGSTSHDGTYTAPQPR